MADDIELSPGDEGTKRHRFLKRWKEIKGSAATYAQLIEALLQIDSAQDAEKVCAVLKDSISTTHDRQVPTTATSATASALSATGGKYFVSIGHFLFSPIC